MAKTDLEGVKNDKDLFANGSHCMVVLLLQNATKLFMIGYDLVQLVKAEITKDSKTFLVNLIISVACPWKLLGYMHETRGPWTTKCSFPWYLVLKKYLINHLDLGKQLKVIYTIYD